MNDPTDSQIYSILRQMLVGQVTRKTASIIMDVEALYGSVDKSGFMVNETHLGFTFYSALHAMAVVEDHSDKFINPEKIKQCLQILELENMMLET